MRVEVIKDATVTVTAGQVVDIRDDEAPAAVRLGLVVPYKEQKKAASKKK